MQIKTKEKSAVELFIGITLTGILFSALPMLSMSLPQHKALTVLIATASALNLGAMMYFSITAPSVWWRVFQMLIACAGIVIVFGFLLSGFPPQ